MAAGDAQLAANLYWDTADQRAHQPMDTQTDEVRAPIESRVDNVSLLYLFYSNSASRTSWIIL